MGKNNIKSAAYVGDTQGDADAASFAGIDFIFAQYGFGDVKEYLSLSKSRYSFKLSIDKGSRKCYDIII